MMRIPLTMNTSITTSLWAASSLLTTLLSNTNAAAGEASHVREYFYIGGEYIKTTSGSLFHNQMYVEKLTPSCGVSQKYPVVFLHGGAQTGTVGGFVNLNIQHHSIRSLMLHMPEVSKTELS